MVASSSSGRSAWPRYSHSTARRKYFAAFRPFAAMLTSLPIVLRADLDSQQRPQHSPNLSWAATAAWPTSNNYYTHYHSFHLTISSISHYTQRYFAAEYPIASYDMIN